MDSMSHTASSQAGAFEEIKQRFLAGGDGLEAVAAHSAATDEVVSRCFRETFPDAPSSGAALIAVGGYGRSQLFPYSDVDLLLLLERTAHANTYKNQTSKLLTALWDSKLRVSHSVRTPAECARLAHDNTELNISLLDARFLAGDEALYQDLRYRHLPRFYVREKRALLSNLIELAHRRHLLAGQTIYHLEPDVKATPGGLRDFQLACWVSQLINASNARLPDSEECLPAESREQLLEAKRFLFAVRCFVHYFNGRDNNKLTFDLQDQVAEESAGKGFPETTDTSDWMREYFRRVRIIYRLVTRAIEESASAGQSLFTFFRDRKSRLSNNDFVVQRGRLYLRNSEALVQQPPLALLLFQFVSRHGIPLAVETERRVENALQEIGECSRVEDPLWPMVAEVLKLPHAYEALTAMHETGALAAVFPEFELVDCLVIRDFFHRYTVDEHTFVTIRNLQELADTADDLTGRFAGLLSELDQPELLYFALLFHDLGKGVSEGDHAERSLELADKAMARIRMEEADRELVRFLIRHHLAPSAMMTGRDLADPETIEELADLVGTIERLKALTLMTLADISAVNPKALTDWRKDLLWQLYIATHNSLTRDIEDRRIHVEPTETYLEAAPTADERSAVGAFLEGFPQRYIRTHSPEQVYAQFQLSRELKTKRSAVSLRRRHSLHEVVVVTWDRPFLFASLCATLSSFGLNIEKAEAFANSQKMTLDTFIVSDPLRTLESDPAESSRLTQTLGRVAEGATDVRDLLKRRQSKFAVKGRVRVEPRVAIDNQTSSRATVAHVIAEDRTGLLFDLASKFSQHECDIEVVLIDTQGQKAIDVFYVVGPNGKLDPATCEVLQEELLEACRNPQPT